MNKFDAVIVGGGPGGSVAGATLSRAGRRVLILEKEKFPRFHIGESLIPFGNDVLRDIGVWDKVSRAGFTVKPGAEFTLGNSLGSLRFWFGRNLESPYAETFQVERARFDSLLLEHAHENGCEIVHKAQAEKVHISEYSVQVNYKQKGQVFTVEADWIIDASGRETFLGRQLSVPKSDLGLTKKFAIFSHFNGVRRNDGAAAGIITIVRLPNAWFWIIPLDQEKTSVGLVQTLDAFKAAKETPAECFERCVQQYPELRFRMKSAQRITDYHSTGDYSYRFDQTAGERWIMVGDAAGFIDPIFSSGVMVAMKSGQLAATTLMGARARRQGLAPSVQRSYTRQIHKMTDVFYRMIQMFYDNRAFEVFMNPSSVFGLTRSVVNLVGGNTQLPWNLRGSVNLFYFLCWLQRWLPVAPRLDYRETPVLSGTVRS